MVFSANYSGASGANNEGNVSADTNPFTQTYSTLNETPSNHNTNSSNFREEEEEDLVGV